jgi:predicted aspartyl protease
MKAQTTMLLAALSAALATAAPAATPVLPAPPLPNATSTAATITDGTITDEPGSDVDLRRLGDRMGVDVTIDGAGPYRFMVDSGANRTVISRALAAKLGLEAEGQLDLHSMGGMARVDAVRVPMLELGGIKTDPITAPVLDGANIGGAAILGIDALRGKRVVIDLVASKMTIRGSTRRIEPAATGEIVVTARRRGGQLILADAQIGGERVDAVIDSGSDTTIGNLALQARLTAHRRAAAIPVTLLDVTGRVTPAMMAPINDLRLGEIKLVNVPVAFTDAHAFHQFGLVKRPALLIGMDVLRAFRRVSIDFASRSIRFLVDQPGGGATQVAVR